MTSGSGALGGAKEADLVEQLNVVEVGIEMSSRSVLDRRMESRTWVATTRWFCLMPKMPMSSSIEERAEVVGKDLMHLAMSREAN